MDVVPWASENVRRPRVGRTMRLCRIVAIDFRADTPDPPLHIDVPKVLSSPLASIGRFVGNLEIVGGTFRMHGKSENAIDSDGGVTVQPHLIFIARVSASGVVILADAPAFS